MARSGGKGRPSGPLPRDVLVSKKLSWLLRHGAEKEGLKLGKGGYVNMADVLANRNIKSIGAPSLDEVRTIVAENAKQRFSLIHISEAREASEATSGLSSGLSNQSLDLDPKNYLIRANQGHSLKVDDEGLLTPITAEGANIPDLVVHGSRHEHWPKILASGGLKPMTRNHVHFATGVPKSLQSQTASSPSVDPQDGEVAVLQEKATHLTISGMRNTSTLLMFLNLRLALDRGLRFFMSDNGVVLSEGDENGLVSLELFSRVEEKGGRLLVVEGKVVADMDVKFNSQARPKSKNGPGSKKGLAVGKNARLNGPDLVADD